MEQTFRAFVGIKRRDGKEVFVSVESFLKAAGDLLREAGGFTDKQIQQKLDQVGWWGSGWSDLDKRRLVRKVMPEFTVPLRKAPR